MRLRILVVAAMSLVPNAARAQSTLATVSGAVYDEQHRSVPGATITLRSLDTAQLRNVVSDGTGHFRVFGLIPGRYDMQVVFAGFETDHVSDLSLGISAEVKRDVTLRLTSVSERVTVMAPAPIATTSKIIWGRTFGTREIDELPVGARDFTNLALLTPGILGNYSTSRGTDPGIVAVGQIGRNNTFLVDGLSLDAHLGSGVRGSVSLDTVKEFMVLPNNFSAEYGHASGAVVSVLTRSGTNEYAGRAFYYHRDDAWDATSGAARLTVPPGDKTRLEQQSVGGFLGGPIVRNRAFFFGSMEQTRRDSESIVTSPVLQVFRPAAPTQLPVRFRNPQVFTRSDVLIGGRNTLSLHSRLDRRTLTNQAVERLSEGFVAPERRQDRTTANHEFVATDNHVFGFRVLNEFRVQVARRSIETGVDNYCGGCVTENRPGILLGKSDIAPERSTERTWQLADTVAYVPLNKLGEHALKIGAELSPINITGFQPAGFDGVFTFTTNRRFDATDASTYPTLYRRNTGDPFYGMNSGIYALFFQDEWRLAPRLTSTLGLRWDYEDAIHVSEDRDNLAPRIALAVDPSGNGKTSVRAGYGVYYDAVLFQALVNTFRGSQVARLQVASPGYPDPFGPNPNRRGAALNALPNGRRFADRIRTPYTEQIIVGVSHVQASLSMTADVVWARGRNLIRTRDANYPDLDDPRRSRPDPAFQEITVRETEGRSSYRALQVGLQKRHSRRHSYAVAYTLSRALRDTEDWDFVPQDQRDYSAEWGPSSSDARHRLAASANFDLLWGFRLATVLTARSALPYNVTTGADDNRDTYVNDRPPGVTRNAARGSALWQVDARLSKAFGTGARKIELIAEVFNVANHRNWIEYNGVLRNATFGTPTDAAAPREIQVGIRVGF